MLCILLLNVDDWIIKTDGLAAERASIATLGISRMM